ncbi:unnamed protein product [Prunus armeniaca]|uniref:Knottin scorpion toxin-like domain-containing protein n=1 Tax=Prunus armeniaca TaxID=36596 RepID=A0A6J5XPH3_PRUAR|nr:unnamed protein product [Prunus armeniaca]
MESKMLRSAVVVCFLLGLLIGQSQATFQECYAGCMLICFIKQHKIGCFAKCLKSCFVIPTDIQAKPEHYCKLDEDKVNACVDSCSGPCSKSYFLSAKN